jgi:branched-subunit amino acid transport protein
MIDTMTNTNFVLLILGTMLVTYIPRMLPLVILSKTKLPNLVERFLDFIPIAILGSILLSELVLVDDRLDVSFENDFLIVGILTIVLARFIKRVDIIVLVGIVLTIIYRYFM